MHFEHCQSCLSSSDFHTALVHCGILGVRSLIIILFVTEFVYISMRSNLADANENDPSAKKSAVADWLGVAPGMSETHSVLQYTTCTERGYHVMV